MLDLHLGKTFCQSFSLMTLTVQALVCFKYFEDDHQKVIKLFTYGALYRTAEAALGLFKIVNIIKESIYKSLLEFRI